MEAKAEGPRGGDSAGDPRAVLMAIEYERELMLEAKKPPAFGE